MTKNKKPFIIELSKMILLGKDEEDLIMKKKVGFLLAIMMIVTTIPITASAQWENPLKKYNLYDDVTGGGQQTNSDRERVMDSFYDNSLRPSQRANTNSATSSSVSIPSTLPIYEIQESAATAAPRRNEILRESSRNVYADTTSPAGWEVGPSFYPNPSFNSIVAKYKKSDFAGCLQECTSYVRKNPNDTLGFYYLAMCYAKVSDKDNAIRAYEKVISLNANPMIVKYATNGRNCVMGNDNEKCYQNVNVPELIYPYKNIANSIDLTPIDPNTLINRNLAQLRTKLSQEQEAQENAENSNNPNNPNDPNANKKEISLPFGKQDSDLDKFINAPYGNGLSPDLNKEYKQLQLKKFQETINQENENSLDNNKYQNIKDIKNFDREKTDSEEIKLAYEVPDNVLKDIENSPEYIQQKKELDELNMLLGNDKSSNKNDITDLIPYLNEENSKNLSPEVIQTMMMQSMMGGLGI
jgi:hypothetical protein